MDIATADTPQPKAPEKASSNANGTSIAAITRSAPPPAAVGVFIKKSASATPTVGPPGGAVKVSGLNAPIGAGAGVKMTASVTVEMPTGYKSIDRNIYVCRSEIKLKTHELPRCSCKEGQRCAPTECENAKLFIECSPERCPQGDLCLNQRFQKRQYAGIIPKRSGAKGWGIFAQLPISAGQFVMEYVGEVIDADELEIRSKACANAPHYYFLSLTGGETIDASKKGNISRFINHSCDPNCVTQKWQVNGESKVGIFALRPIRVGEELTFDYQFERFSHKKQRCLCGASNCSKYLGSKPKPKDGDLIRRMKKQAKEEIRYAEISEAPFPEEHVAVLLDDQDLDAFPFTPTDGKWYFLRDSEIPMETDTEDSSSDSSSSSDADSSDESDSESSTEAEQPLKDEPPRKARKLEEGATPADSNSAAHTGSGNSKLNDNNAKVKKTKERKVESESDSDSDSDSERPQHRARDFVHKLPNRAPIFRRTQAHQQRLRLLDQYTDMLYEKIDKQKEKKTLMQDAELAAVSSLLGVDATNQSWMASLDIKQLSKDGLLEFEPYSPSERRRVSTRSRK